MAIFNAHPTPPISAGTVESWSYLASYQDLETAFGFNDVLAANHYNLTFSTEHRAITFNAYEYEASNIDLLNYFGQNVAGAAKHYVVAGRFELNRPVATFDGYAYLHANADLLAAFGGDADGGVERATEHYVLQGYFEITHNLRTSAGTPLGAYTLTPGTDIKTANLFYAPLSSNGLLSVVNTLQDVDHLTGTGANPTLNATLGSIDGLNAGAQSHIVTPILTGIETINIDFAGNGNGNQRFDYSGPLLNLNSAVDTLDLQDSTGVKTVNINRITDPNNSVAVVNFTSVPTNLSVNNTSSPTGAVTFSVLDSAAAGSNDSTTLTLSNVTLQELNLNSANNDRPYTHNANGIENVTLVSAGSANSVGVFSDTDLSVLTIKGAQNLTIGEIDYTNQGKFTTIDGSTATGKLNLTLDSLDAAANATPYGTTGGDVAFTLTTGSGDDTINSTINFGSGNDVVDAGAGHDTLALSAAEDQSFTDNATYKNFEAVTVTFTEGTDSGDPDGEVLTVDSANITGDQTFFLVSKATIDDPVTYVLNNLSAVEAQQITIAHSGANAQSTGNNGVVDSTIIANLATDTSNDTVGVAIVNGTNKDPRFNFELTAPKVENIIITDSDTESNTVKLNSFAVETGTITLKGGVAGQFLNLDTNTVSGSGGSTVQGGGYGFDVTGGKADPVVTDTAVSKVFTSVLGDQLIIAQTIDATAEKSDVIVRVGTADQTIKLGTGNDTVIFADRTGITKGTAGLTGGDVVSGGAGWDTIVLDGTAVQTLGASEWQYLTGIDAIRLAGTAGSTFNLEITNELVGQTDLGNRLTIINNDGLLGTNSENTANIDLRGLNLNHFVTFVGPNGDGTNTLGAVQTVLVSQASINGNDILNGGDNNIVTTYAATPAGDALWASNIASGHDGNHNVLAVYNSATVTANDLVHVSNFDNIEFHNSTANVQTLNLTLDSVTVDRLVDASHTATTTQVETLNITDLDSSTVLGAYSVLNLNAGSVGSQFSLHVDLTDADAAGSYHNTIVTGAGNDTIDIGHSTGKQYITAGNGADTVNIANGVAIFSGEDHLLYTAAGQTYQGVVSSGVTILEPVAGPSFSPLLGADIVNLTGGAAANPTVYFDLNGVLASGVSGIVTTNGLQTNLLDGTVNAVHITTGHYDAAGTHEFVAAASGSGNYDVLLQWDTNGTLAGGVETVIITGVSSEHVGSGSTLSGGVLHLAV